MAYPIDHGQIAGHRVMALWLSRRQGRLIGHAPRWPLETDGATNEIHTGPVDRFARNAPVSHRHCEERSDVAISPRAKETNRLLCLNHQLGRHRVGSASWRHHMSRSEITRCQ